MQSHPIPRPDTHQPYPHLPDPAPLASGTPSGHHSPSISSSSPHHTRRGIDRQVQYDVLSSFKKEMERVRKDAQGVAYTARILEQKAADRSPSMAATLPIEGFRSDTMRPNASLMSTVATLMRPSSARSTQPPSSATEGKAEPQPFGLASSHAPSQISASLLASSSQPLNPTSNSASFFRSSTLSSALSSDPHVQSLYARASSLLSNGSVGGSDAVSQSRLQTLLTSLHDWKGFQSGELQGRIATIEANHHARLRDLLQQYERERANIEAEKREEIDRARRDHQRIIDERVEELHEQMEDEFRKTGSIGMNFHSTLSRSMPASSQSARSSTPSRSHTSTSRVIGSARRAPLDRSLRMEHLDQSSTLGHTRSRLHEEEEKERMVHGFQDDVDDDEESERAAQRRSQLRWSQYNPTSPRPSSKLSHSVPFTSTSTRQTVSSILDSDDDDDDDHVDSVRKRQLMEQAAYLKSRQRARYGAPTSDLSLSYGLSASSRGRSQSRRAASAREKERASLEARILLESSSDDDITRPDAETELRSSLSRTSNYKPRTSASVSFSAASLLKSSPLSHRKRTQRDVAIKVFGESDEDDGDNDEPIPIRRSPLFHVAPVDAKLDAARAQLAASVASSSLPSRSPSRSRLNLSQSGHAPAPVTQMASSLQQRLKAIQRRGR